MKQKVCYLTVKKACWLNFQRKGVSPTAVIGEELQLSVSSKVFMHVIQNRIRDHNDTCLQREQVYFRSSRLRTDRINTLRIITEQSSEFIANLYLVFIDFEEALDLLL